MKLRTLTEEEISQLASRPKVRRIAVENFLATMGTDEHTAIQNLYLDARLYGWNKDTIRAIREGIKLARRKS